MNIFYKNNGHISIFLTIVLVPVIVFSALFIDVSRVRMAKPLAESSADLAMNSVLSQYDTTLSDYYGMMASCQDISDFYDTAKKYFEFCMVSQGVSVGDAQKWSETMGGMLEGTEENINDLMLLSPVEDSLNIEEVNNANLANPVMVKEEIVEFMKYRAPIELLGELQGNSGFVSKLESVQDKVENLPAETQIQKEKFEYYEAENELLKKALECYALMTVYEDFKPYGDNYMDDAYMEKVLNDMKSGNIDMEGIVNEINADNTDSEVQKGLEEKFMALHGLYVTYWANTEGAQEFTSVESYVAQNGNKTLDGQQDKGGLRNAINECISARNTYETKKQEMQNVLNQIEGANPDPSREINEVQYWMYMVRKLKECGGNTYQDYLEAQAEFSRRRLNLEYAMNNKKPGKRLVPKEDYDPILKRPFIRYEEETYNIGGDDYGDGRTYDQALQNEWDAADSVWGARTGEAIYNISSNLESYSKTAINSGKLYNGEEKISDALADIKEDYKNLVTAQESLEILSQSLDELVGLVEDYKEAHDTWEEDVDANLDRDSDVIDRDREELDIIDGDTDISEEDRQQRGLTTVDIEPDDVRAYQTRLNNTVELIKSYRATIESICYRGQVIVGKKTNDKTEYCGDGIHNPATFRAVAESVTGSCTAPAVEKNNIPFYQDELDTYIMQTFEITDGLDSLAEVTAENSPKMHDYDNLDNYEGIEDFDKWLHDKFDAMEVTKDIADGLLDRLKQLMDSLAPENLANFGPYTNVTLSDKKIKGWGTLPSGGASDKADSVEEGKNEDGKTDVKTKLDAGSEAGGLFANINFEELYEGERDNLYAMEYIMKMFTYETSALEGMYNMGRERLGEEQGKDNIYLVKVKDGAEIEMAPKIAGNLYDQDWDKEKKTWGEERLTFIYNKSMTNKMQNWDNNYLYGREVEYILYGGDTESSRDAMGTTLFFTRFGLDVGPVLDMYWNDKPVKDIARGISTATAGVVPALAVKLVICMGICAAEAAVDMNYLKAGLPVLFYKDDPLDQLFIKLTIDADSFLDNMKAGTEYNGSIIDKNESAIGESDGPFFQYSDYIRIFLFVGMHLSEENIYKRTADIIQMNMQNNENLSDYDNFKMSEAHTGYQIKYKIKVESLLLKIPFARQSGSEDLLNSDGWNTFTGEMMREY